MKNENVILVTVTYNSSHLLKRLIKAAHEQTYKLDKMIIVDNASSGVHYSQIKALSNQYYEIDIVELNQNLGGAGGFQKGIEYAVCNYPNCNWLWLIDDDAYPDADCLEKLMRFHELENVGCLCPVIYGIDLQKFQLYHHKMVSKFLNKDVNIAYAYDDLAPVSKMDATAFVGPLIKVDVIKKIGFPDGSLFIYGDDLEYTYRISRKYNVYLIKEARINHRDTVQTDSVIRPSQIWKSYYFYRNRFFFIKKYQKTWIQGAWGKILLGKSVLREIGSVIKNKKYRGMKIMKIKYLCKAMADGLSYKKGKTVDPKWFIKND